MNRHSYDSPFDFMAFLASKWCSLRPDDAMVPVRWAHYKRRIFLCQQAGFCWLFWGILKNKARQKQNDCLGMLFLLENTEAPERCNIFLIYYTFILESVQCDGLPLLQNLCFVSFDEVGILIKTLFQGLLRYFKLYFLPLSAHRWQFESVSVVATFIYSIITGNLIRLQTLMVSGMTAGSCQKTFQLINVRVHLYYFLFISSPRRLAKPLRCWIIVEHAAYDAWSSEGAHVVWRALYFSTVEKLIFVLVRIYLSKWVVVHRGIQKKKKTNKKRIKVFLKFMVQGVLFLLIPLSIKLQYLEEHRNMNSILLRSYSYQLKASIDSFLCFFLLTVFWPLRVPLH